MFKVNLEELKELFVGSYIPEDQVEAREIIKEEIGFDLPDDAYVIYIHQGYCFAYIRENEKPDYPVYYGCEGLPIKQTHDSYIEFLTITKLNLEFVKEFSK